MNYLKLEKILNQLLNIEQFHDYAPNGLQIKGKSEIKKIVTGVTASQKLIDRAIELGADAILVHHGYFWKNEDPRLIGMKYNRIKALLDHNINLYAYHLPLDAHLTLGNNVQLAKQLNLKFKIDSSYPELLLQIKLQESLSTMELQQKLEHSLSRHVIYSGELSRPKPIMKIGICTGGGQDFIDAAIQSNCDAFITGEVSERTIHIARENDLYFYSAGHHATERYGIKALGDYLSEDYALQVEFIDIDNPA